ncbi:PiggyBac transposable element-derived protein 3 [Plakobranchus ocellatus]|uniref:PiggyBac transposable element-derived protein 3 n=1 Tax=Plakobranchus ocellatus TaxID=259542 RepID=A0AAV3Y5Y0_9GAST|nr:PiggyBac transposable element-derived protein 3 [Plakobranchus ocellatus]
MAKIRPLISDLNEKFKLYWPETQALNVDESMIPYYGRHQCKQFIQNKPIRYGHKIWCLNSPSGYLVQFEPYQGAGIVENKYGLGMGGSVVIALRKELPAKSYHLFFDNLFSSVPLFEELSAIGMSGTGTMRQNRVQKCPLSDKDDEER